MSHFATITTQIKDLAALTSACTELGLTVVAHATARGYSTNTVRGEHVIRLQGPYDIALNRQADGSFGLTTDWWDGHVEKQVGPNYGRLLQLYADGSTSCDCPGWCKRTAADGSRSCKHTRSVLLGAADRECERTHDYGAAVSVPVTATPATRAIAHFGEVGRRKIQT